MDINWNEFKYEFSSFVINKNITTFNNFYDNVRIMTNEMKGIYFEYFCNLYFNIETITKSKYKDFYMYNEIPSKLRKKLNLPTKDKGIDGIVIDNNDKIYAIQVKFRTNYNKIIPFGELATFPALTFGTDVKIDGGIFFSNCSNVCDELKNDKYVHILFNSLNSKCDKLFWQNVIEYIGKKNITKYVTKSPLIHQQQIIQSIKNYYIDKNKGILFMPCGTGKTFTSFWLCVRILEYNKIFIVVPSLYLLSQTYETWMKETQYDKDKYHFILIGSDMDNKEDMLCEYKPTTNEDIVEKELLTYKKVVTIITYQSSELLISVCKKNNIIFDIGIYDEAHRTVGEENKCFTSIITADIDNKKLFMTATKKICNYGKKLEKQKSISMDNSFLYGEEIYRYNIRQAIENNVLVDYKIIAPFVNSNKYDEELFNNIFINEENIKFDMKIMLTGVMIINAMHQYKFKHLLIFSNKNDRAKSIIDFIKLYLKKVNHNLQNTLYCKYLSGNDNMNIRKAEVNEFEKMDYAIISSARIFNEGVDIKICDSVCFADGKSSSVDIIQIIGRAMRKYDLMPNKVAYILVPFVVSEKDDFFDNNDASYLKLRKILKTIGKTDDMVTEKFTLVDCSKYKYKNIDKSELINTVNQSTEININNFKDSIITKVFDKVGDSIDIKRNKLIYENKKRYNNHEDLIDTRKKCIMFFKENNILEEPIHITNWIKYAVGDTIFNKLTRKYYYSIDEFKSSCLKLDIKQIDDYKSRNVYDPKLPPYEYVTNGFYYDIYPKFNLELLLSQNEEELDF